MANVIILEIFHMVIDVLLSNELLTLSSEFQFWHLDLFNVQRLSNSGNFNLTWILLSEIRSIIQQYTR